MLETLSEDQEDVGVVQDQDARGSCHALGGITANFQTSVFTSEEEAMGGLGALRHMSFPESLQSHLRLLQGQG